MFKSEIEALKRAGRFRKRELFNQSLKDFASNDYLGLSNRNKSFEKAYIELNKYHSKSPKASQLVNGYHQIHKDFEDSLKKLNGFEDALVVGSGFLANLALIEALPRKKDILILDSEFHASGIMASRLVECEVVRFRHNDAKDLERILETKRYKKAVVCIEGIYSMGGDLAKREIFEVVRGYNTLLVVDEAHSSGVIGKNLNGIFEEYGLKIEPNYIKMGTLGKAYGSYGAYILASSEVVSYLENRAKSIIYATAPSLFDIALAHINQLYIQKNAKNLKKKIKNRQEIFSKIFGKKIDSLIGVIEIDSNEKVLKIKDELKKEGFLVGAIRPPTVKRAIIRAILRVNNSKKDTKALLNRIKEVSHEL
jgi:8-amino-7-oxononanoate synthase